MKKFKYRLIGRSIFEEEKCLEMLEREAASGWRLDKVGMIFFRFKQVSPSQIKFFMNFYQANGEEIRQLKDQGYQYLGSYQKVSFLYSDNLETREPVYNADYKSMAVNEVFGTIKIAALFILALLVGLLFNYNGMIRLLTRSSLAGYLLYFHRVLLSFVGIALGLYLIMNGVEMIFARIKYARLARGENPQVSGYRLIKVFHYIVRFGLLLLIGLEVILLGLNNPRTLGYLTVLAIVFVAFWRLYGKLMIMNNGKLERFIKPASIVVYVFIFNLARYPDINSMIISGNEALQQDAYNYTINNNAILYQSIGYFGSQTPQEKNIEYLSEYREIRYYCLDNFIAQDIFKFKVEELEHRSRGWSDLDQLFLEAGGAKTPIEYQSYQEAIMSLQPIDSDKIDMGYYWNNHYVMIKDKVVLEVLLAEDLPIFDLIDYYMS